MTNENRQELKAKIDFLVMETLRLDRMLLDRQCIESIQNEPEITAIKKDLMALIETIKG